jgi:hypothetical protein
MFLKEFDPPRIRFGDEYLNVINMCVLSDSPVAGLGRELDNIDDVSRHGKYITLQCVNHSSFVYQLFFIDLTQRTANEMHAIFGAFICDDKRRAALLQKGVRRVTLVVSLYDGHMPLYYTYRQRLDYAEDATHRHFEPPLVTTTTILSRYIVVVF